MDRGVAAGLFERHTAANSAVDLEQERTTLFFDRGVARGRAIGVVVAMASLVVGDVDIRIIIHRVVIIPVSMVAVFVVVVVVVVRKSRFGIRVLFDPGLVGNAAEDIESRFGTPYLRFRWHSSDWPGLLLDSRLCGLCGLCGRYERYSGCSGCSGCVLRG